MDVHAPLVNSAATTTGRPLTVRTVAVAACLSLVIAALVLGSVRLATHGSRLPASMPTVATVAVDAFAMEGLDSFTIPAGAATAQQAGAEPYLMPDVMRLHVGDKLVVGNQDVFPHMIFAMVVAPGTTGTMVFDQPGVTDYSSGCTANGGTMNRFTSVIVSEV